MKKRLFLILTLGLGFLVWIGKLIWESIFSDSLLKWLGYERAADLAVDLGLKSLPLVALLLLTIMPWWFFHWKTARPARYVFVKFGDKHPMLAPFFDPWSLIILSIFWIFLGFALFLYSASWARREVLGEYSHRARFLSVGEASGRLIILKDGYGKFSSLRDAYLSKGENLLKNLRSMQTMPAGLSLKPLVAEESGIADVASQMKRLAKGDLNIDIDLTQHPRFDSSAGFFPPEASQIKDEALSRKYRSFLDEYNTSSSAMLGIDQMYKDQMNRIEQEIRAKTNKKMAIAP